MLPVLSPSLSLKFEFWALGLARLYPCHMVPFSISHATLGKRLHWGYIGIMENEMETTIVS